MSLNWTTKEGSPARRALEDERNHGRFQALCLSLMVIGIGKVTEDNVVEVTARLNLVEELFGPYLVRVDDEGRNRSGFTAEDVADFIGLSTNVASESESKWLARTGKNYLTERRRWAQHALNDREARLEATT